MTEWAYSSRWPPKTASIVIATLVLSVLVASHADAAVSCQDSAVKNYFDGVQTPATSYGVAGDIRDRTISLCSNASGATSGASAWVMFSGGASSEYAQIGFGKIAGMSAAQTFTEYNDGEGVPPNWNRTFWPGIFSSGTVHHYIVAYNFSTGKVSMSVGGSNKATTPWAAETEWHTGWHSVYSGETIDSGDDMPGTSTLKTNFTTLTERRCRGCSYTPPLNPSDIPGRRSEYKFQWVAKPSSFNIWTQR